jgi:hypothetical protein
VVVFGISRAGVHRATRSKGLSGADFAGFFTIERRKQKRYFSHRSQLASGKTAVVRLLRTVLRGGCTKTGHWVVDGLHSIENTRVAGGDF